MTDLPSGNDSSPAGNSNPSPRHRYILRTTIVYAVFGALWIMLSDSLLSALVDVAAMQWLSTAKGLFFVLVTTLLLFFFLRSVPGEADSPAVVPRLEAIFALSPARRGWMYGFAVVVTVVMLLVRSGISVPFAERPLLPLFMFPIILSAMAGGLGPGLAATLLAALGLAYGLSPADSLLIAHPHDLFQWSFLAANGVLISILCGVLHRLHRHSEASRRLQVVTLASIGDGVITTDTGGRITFMNLEAERLTGWTSGAAMGRPLVTVFRVIDEQNRQPLESPVDKVMVSGQGVEFSGQGLLLCRDGREVPVVDNGAPIRMGDGALAGLVLVFRDDGKRRRAEEALRESLTEKIALLKEVHHRVKNNLQIVASLLNLQADRTVNPEAVAALLDTRNRVRSMALLHEVLYRSENLARIGLVAYVEELCLHLVRTFGQQADRIRVEQQVADVSLPMAQAMPCGLIINELVINALKYGFPDGKAGRVLVEVALDDGQIVLSVSDNGVGLPPGFDPAASPNLGLQLVSNLAGQLGGSLEWERGADGGAFCRVRFPAPGIIEQGDE